MSEYDLPDGISLDDPRPIHEQSPYTFFMPAHELVAAVGPGDCVQAIFRDRDGGYEAERMWVDIERAEGEQLYGKLANVPAAMSNIALGDKVTLPRTHVINVQLNTSPEPDNVETVRQYWDRCLVDDCILTRKSHVDYLYREEPDMTKEGDKDPDSGWRIRGTREAIEQDKAEDKPIRYVALGAVLNRDDKWLHLIDREVGCAFQWDADKQVYIELA